MEGNAKWKENAREKARTNTEMEFPFELSSHEIRDRRDPDPKTAVAALFAHRGDTGVHP
jgi:hypothetical protein